MTDEQREFQEIKSAISYAMSEADNRPFLEESQNIAETLIRLGYRKQSEVRSDTAREFAEKVKAKLFKQCYNCNPYGVLSTALSCVDELAEQFGKEK